MSKELDFFRLAMIHQKDKEILIFLNVFILKKRQKSCIMSIHDDKYHTFFKEI